MARCVSGRLDARRVEILLADGARWRRGLLAEHDWSFEVVDAPGPRTDSDRELVAGHDRVGLLRLETAAPVPGTALDPVARAVAESVVNQRAQSALRERVKELTCLYNLARITERPGLSLPEVLSAVVQLLPPAWQYPEITAGRIVVDDQDRRSGAWGPEPAAVQRAPVVVDGTERGFVEVAYLEDRPVADEGPFLTDERSLIDAVALHLASHLERRQAAAERARLQEQLRHADRLATIGQLAAGVAHELNEPLGNVLGFAQLAAKTPELPPPALGDLDKIVAAALHAREIIRKLMLFSRQTPPRADRVSLNRLVADGLYFLESRCARSGISVMRELDPELPEIVADPGQMQQVLVNLAVNAVQAMPDGGRLTLRTVRRDGHVVLAVEDTGVGMSAEVRRQCFLPFFTTKDVDQGTGLGLAVVHGIVTAHGGTLQVESTPGHGSRFEVGLPVDGPATGQEQQ